MKPTRCILLLSIFISNSLHVSGNYVPIIRRTYYIYATLVIFAVYGWLPGLQTRRPPIQSEKYQCRTDTVSSPDDGHMLPETCRKVEINILRSSIHLVTSFEKVYTGMRD